MRWAVFSSILLSGAGAAPSSFPLVPRQEVAVEAPGANASVGTGGGDYNTGNGGSDGGYNTGGGSGGGAGAAPKCYTGSEYPAVGTWLSFEALWQKWGPVFLANGNTQAENEAIRSNLVSKAQQGGFQPQFALAVIITESQGKVRGPCGDGGQSCGIFQVKGSQNPCMGKQEECPAADIATMCDCGMVGCEVATGSNIKACFEQQGQNYGQAARCYNTGSVPDVNDLTVAPWGTKQYVHWTANILMGADGEQLQQITRQCGLFSAGTY